MEGMDTQWFMDHAATIILSVAVFIEWVALQALLIHYHLFRKSLKKPTPDGIRFATIEKVLSFQASQIDRVFGKIGEMSKEMIALNERKPAERFVASVVPPVEPGVMSLGELNLKKRLAELRTLAKSETADVINNVKLN